MKFTIDHNNLNVSDLAASLDFYRDALGFRELSRISPADGSFIIVFIGDDGGRRIELTWLAEHNAPYDLGENEFHLAVRTDDFAAAHALHSDMGCICYENPAMGLYFIHDPDDYWTEILPQ